MPANGWWHEWTFNYDVKVDNNEVHMDIAEREAKILVFRGDNWQPAPPPASEPVVESAPAPAPVPEPTASSSKEQKPDGSAKQSPPLDAPSQ